MAVVRFGTSSLVSASEGWGESEGVGVEVQGEKVG